jgi:hypothetical protein
MRRSAPVIAAGFVVLGCSSSSSGPSPPDGYSLFFPSTDVAVATDTVEVLVFDVPPDQPDLCATLVLRKKSNQDLGPSLATSTPRPVCDLATGRGALTVSFGKRAFLAVGRQGQDDYLVGCAALDVAAGTPAPSIYLEYVNDTVRPAPPTQCQSLSQKCKGGC